MTIRVLIIDDSPTMRAILMARLKDEHDIEVVGSAANAAEGRAAMKDLDPDVVTLDIEMPGMNGLDFLEKIMQLRPTPVIVVSGATQKGNSVTARALALGAVDCYCKTDRSGAMMVDDHGRLADLIRLASNVKMDRSPKIAVHASQVMPRSDTSLIAIGSSTGGVEALHILLRELPADCPPTVIVQHINARFAASVAASLDTSCKAKVQIAEANMPLERGNVYFAQGDKHLLIGGQDRLRCRIKAGPHVSGHCPSVDTLFHSVAELKDPHAVGILLTGMGRDGAEGMLAMAQQGALTIAQDEETSTVFGMPRAAIAIGAAKLVAPIHAIARHALRKAA